MKFEDFTPACFRIRVFWYTVFVLVVSKISRKGSPFTCRAKESKKNANPRKSVKQLN